MFFQFNKITRTCKLQQRCIYIIAIAHILLCAYKYACVYGIGLNGVCTHYYSIMYRGVPTGIYELCTMYVLQRCAMFCYPRVLQRRKPRDTQFSIILRIILHRRSQLPFHRKQPLFGKVTKSRPMSIYNNVAK